jgi:hypothetical protein
MWKWFAITQLDNRKFIIIELYVSYREILCLQDKAKTLFRRAENFLQAYYLAGYAQAVLRQWDLAMRYFQYVRLFRFCF